jgi:hypothetical protein
VPVRCSPIRIGTRLLAADQKTAGSA